MNNINKIKILYWLKVKYFFDDTNKFKIILALMMIYYQFKLMIFKFDKYKIQNLIQCFLFKAKL